MRYVVVFFDIDQMYSKVTLSLFSTVYPLIVFLSTVRTGILQKAEKRVFEYFFFRTESELASTTKLRTSFDSSSLPITDTPSTPFPQVNPATPTKSFTSVFSRTSSTESREGEGEGGGGEGREVGEGGEGKDLTPRKSWLKKHLDSVNPDVHDSQQKYQPLQQRLVEPRQQHSQLLLEPRQQQSQLLLEQRQQQPQLSLEPRQPQSQLSLEPRQQQSQLSLEPRQQQQLLLDSRKQMKPVYIIPQVVF